jgi:hypothetical protein
MSAMYEYNSSIVSIVFVFDTISEPCILGLVWVWRSDATPGRVVMDDISLQDIVFKKFTSHNTVDRRKACVLLSLKIPWESERLIKFGQQISYWFYVNLCRPDTVGWIITDLNQSPNIDFSDVFHHSMTMQEAVHCRLCIFNSPGNAYLKYLGQ